MKNISDCPIGVFDSGVGGISVLSALRRELPFEDFVYFGDSAHAPYGTKTPEEVLQFSEQILTHFRTVPVKALVIACNTATAAAADTLRQRYVQLPIIGVEPAIKPTATFTEHPKVLILATPMTLCLEKFRHLLKSLEEKADFFLLPCPGLVELIEQGKTDCPETEGYLRQTLASYLDAPPDAVVLGCTHFPFVKPLLQKLFGEKVRFFDGAEGTARQLHRRLEESELLSARTAEGSLRLESSDPSGQAVRLMQTLLNRLV